MLKTKKLTLKKEKLRTLLDNELAEVVGAKVNGTSGCGWCSSGNVSKCYTGCGPTGGAQCYMR